MRQHIKKALIPIGLFLLFSFIFIGCKSIYDIIEVLETPTACMTVYAKNISTKEEIAIKYEGYYVTSYITLSYNGEDVLYSATSAEKVLYCEPGNEIVINYSLFHNGDSSRWGFVKTSSTITGLDWEKSFDDTNFEISFAVPDLPSGIYPITCSTIYKIKSDAEVGVSSKEPIETTVLLVIR